MSEINNLAQQIRNNLAAIDRFNMGFELGVNYPKFRALEAALANAKTLNEVLAVDDALREFHLDLLTQIEAPLARMKKRLARMRNWSQDIWDSAKQNAIDTISDNQVYRDSISPLLLDYIQSDSHIRTMSSELSMLEDPSNLFYTPEQIKAAEKVAKAANDAREINVSKPAQAKKLYDKLTKKVQIDSKLVDDFLAIYNDASYDPEDKAIELSPVLDQIIDNYENRELYRVTDGRSGAVETLDVENSMYNLEARQDINSFVEFMRDSFSHEEAEQMRYYIPYFSSWWYDTTQKLMARGIKDPKPLEQYELLNLPENIPLVRNEIECK